MAEQVRVTISGGVVKAEPIEKAPANPDMWKCGPCQSGTGTCCTRKDLPKTKPSWVTTDWTAGMKQARKQKEEAMRKATQVNAPVTINDGPHKPKYPGHASPEHRAAEEVERIAVELQDRNNGSKWTYLTREQAITQALGQVSSETKSAYAAYRARLDRERADANAAVSGGGQVQKGRSGAVDLGTALAKHAEAAVAKGEPTPITKASEQIRAARLAKGWSQERLATEAGCHRQTVVNVENDKTQISGLILSAVCQALNLDPMSLGR